MKKNSGLTAWDREKKLQLGNPLPLFSKLNSDDEDSVSKTNLNVEKAYMGGICSVGRLLKCQFYNTSQNILNANYKTQRITKY